jgi:hypothetical protein
MADSEHLIIAIRGLKAIIHNNQAKIRAEIETIHDGQEGVKSGQAEMEATVSGILQSPGKKR